MRDCHFNFLLWRHPQVRFRFLLFFVDYDKKRKPRENAIKGLMHKFELRKAEDDLVKNPHGSTFVLQPLRLTA